MTKAKKGERMRAKNKVGGVLVRGLALGALAIAWSLVSVANLPAQPVDPPPPVPAGGIVGEIVAAGAICGYVLKRARRRK